MTYLGEQTSCTESGDMRAWHAKRRAAAAHSSPELPGPPRYARHARSLTTRKVRQRIIALTLLGAVVVVFAAAARPAMRIFGRTAPQAPLLAVSRIRNDAAGWVATWVADGANVGCDAAMCPVLRKHGLPWSRLVRLTTSAVDPMNCDVIVATTVIRERYGVRLAGVYAPLKLASFGSGGLRVVIRSVDNIGGTARYLRAVRAGVRARMVLGRALLGNKNISVRPGAAAVLKAGEADPSLLLSLPVLARSGPITILRFGPRAPGASAGMPVLSADLTAGPAPGGMNPVSTGYVRIRAAVALEPVLSFLRIQRTPLRSASFRVLTAPSGVPFIRIDYAAPAPLNVFSGTLDAYP